MKIFRSLLAGVALVGAAFNLTAADGPMAWSGGQATTYNAGTNKAMALTTNAYFQVDVPRSEEVSLLCNYKFLNAPSGGDLNAIRIDFYRGIDPGKWETNVWRSWTVAGNSTTPSCDMTNLSVAGVPYLRARIANVGTNSHATNILVLYGSKR